MTKQEKDILQIKKYLEGKLDARARYELERQAQDDPFLMDALEGYENTGKPQDENLKDLSQRLQHRIEKKERKIIPLRFIAIAASVLLVLFAGLLWYINQRPVQKMQITKISIPPAKKPVDTLSIPPNKTTELAKLSEEKPTKTYLKAKQTTSSPNADATINTSVGANDKLAYNSPASIGKSALKEESKKASTSNNSTPLNEAIVMDYSTQKLSGKVAGLSIDTTSKVIKGMVRDANGPLAGASIRVKGSDIGAVTDSHGNFTINAVPYQSELDITYVGYTSKQVKIKKQDSLIIAMQPANSNSLAEVVTIGYGKAKKANVTSTAGNDKVITGIVNDEAGNPLPGVTVKIKGTNIGTQTNSNGKFTLNPGTAYAGSTLEVDFIGYEREDVAIKKSTPLVIALRANNNSLSEVVVTDNTQQEQQQLSARPGNGWADFKKYLKENAQSPDSKTGTVKLSFIVNTNRALSDFKIIKSISPKTDSVAIQLIKAGPYWLGNTNNKPETVKVRIKFEAKR